MVNFAYFIYFLLYEYLFIYRNKNIIEFYWTIIFNSVHKNK